MKPNFTDLKISKTLRALREYKGEKLLAVATFLNMSECNYSKYESGKIAFTIGFLKQVCEYYKIDVNVIFTLSENHFTNQTLSDYFAQNNHSIYTSNQKNKSNNSEGGGGKCAFSSLLSNNFHIMKAI